MALQPSSTRRDEPEQLAARLLAGERLAVARLISWAERGDPGFAAAMRHFYPRVGRAGRVGVTGPPGAGKSTLVNELVQLHRAQDRTVGVLAVDPSSPFTGGALLGDRIRMEDRTSDPGVFIRSMASRGSHGGIARAAIDACDVMDAFGFDELLIETVGVGQAEYDVVSAADTVLVVLCPGAGDGIQALKSGLLEVADVLVVNKSDAPGAERLVRDLEEAVHLRRDETRDWRPPVVSCSAGRSQGVAAVLDAVELHRAHIMPRLGESRRAQRLGQVRRTLGEALERELWEHRGYGARAMTLLAQGVTPYEAAEGLLTELVGLLGAAQRTN